MLSGIGGVGHNASRGGKGGGTGDGSDVRWQLCRNRSAPRSGEVRRNVVALFRSPRYWPRAHPIVAVEGIPVWTHSNVWNFDGVFSAPIFQDGRPAKAGN